MGVTLTILLVVDVEKPPEYLDWYAAGLARLNSSAELGRDYQVLFLNQHHGDRWTAAGYPVWDLLEQTAQAWPLVEGEYVTWAHSEFLWCTDRLRRTIDWLRQHRPVIALGNLRRTGDDRLYQAHTLDRGMKLASDPITDHLRRGDWEAAAIAAEQTPTTNWMANPHQPLPTDAPAWLEDVFFVRRDWLEVTEFLHHGRPQFFQDVYDLMDAAQVKLGVHDATPRCPRLPQSVCRLVHLWHDRRMRHLGPDVRRYFLRNAARYDGTLYASREHWRRLDACFTAAKRDEGAIWPWRRDPGGTVWRWAMDFEAWLERGGAEDCRRYLARHQATREAIAWA